MAIKRPAAGPAVQKSALWGFPRQPSSSHGRRSPLPNNMSSRKSLHSAFSNQALAAHTWDCRRSCGACVCSGLG